MSTISDLTSAAHRREEFEAGRIVSGASPLFGMCSGVVPSSLCQHFSEDLGQGRGRDRHTLLDMFRSDEQAVSTKLRGVSERQIRCDALFDAWDESSAKAPRLGWFSRGIRFARAPVQVPEGLRRGDDQRHGKINVHDARQCHFGLRSVDGMNRQVPGDIMTNETTATTHPLSIAFQASCPRFRPPSRLARSHP